MNVPSTIRKARGFSFALLGSALLFAGACSGGSSSNASGGSQGSGGSASGGKTGSGGGNGSGGSASGGSVGSGGSGSGGSASGGKVGSGGSGSGGTASGGVVGSGGSASGGVVGSGGNASGGSASGGSVGAASGGASSGGAPGSGGAAGGSRGSGGTTGAGGGGSGSSDCPAGATFCSDFEEASGPPTGATVRSDGGMFGDLMALDKTVHHGGVQSLKVLPATGGSAFRMLSVAVPGPTFWARFFYRTDQDFGGMNHDSIAQAMTDPDHNKSTTSVEVAEQFCQVLLNEHDAIFPMGLSGCSTMGPVLKAGDWHCMEVFVDGANGNVQVYADNNKIIDAAGWSHAKATFTTFEFGYASYANPGRTNWYDDVVVASARVGGCQ
jgi:hypothetical protein